MSRTDPRSMWNEVYRLARLTPCADGANLTWLEAYQYPMTVVAITAAWTGDLGDALSEPMHLRRLYHRAGISTSYIVSKGARPRLPQWEPPFTRRDREVTTSTEREEARKRDQGYDPDIARCGNCLYFTMGTDQERALARKRGYGFTALQRCTFGDFNTTPVGICDEWRNRAGERLETADDEEAPAR